MLLIGTKESILDDSTRFFSAASTTSVDVQLEKWAGLYHGWYLFSNAIAETEAIYNRMGYLIRGLSPL
jgi:acetyl esterase/lipase